MSGNVVESCSLLEFLHAQHEFLPQKLGIDEVRGEAKAVYMRMLCPSKRS
jgi:hypothetical protein